MKRAIAFSFALLSLSSPLPASAQDCGGPVRDFHEALGPVRNQHDEGWCYANAAVDLVAYKYRDELKGEKLSAVFQALLNNSIARFKTGSASEGGFIRSAVEATMKWGGCRQDKEDDFLAQGPAGSLKEKITRMVELWRLRKKPALLEKKVGAYIDQGSILSTIGIEGVKAALAETWFEKDWGYNLGKRVCGSRDWQPTYRARMWSDTKYLHLGGAESLLKVIDEQLTANNPVGMDYYADFLTSTSGRKEGGHASVLVGRRWNDQRKTCQYLIRNSWGPACSGYTEDINYDCVDGNLWVSRQQILDNLISISYFY
jgi:hypothetical protein